MNKKDTTKRLTEGRPMSLIIGFSLPLLVGMLFQQLYSLVDTIIVGKCIGTDALAAVGSTGSINFLINGFCMGVCAGFAIPMAQRFGAEDEKGLRRFVANALWLSVIFAVVMTFFVVIYCHKILELMQTPDNIIEDAYIYIVIIFAGIPVTYLYNMTAGTIRALGDSKTPVYFLLMASVINIALDLLLIVGLGYGVEGAGFATVFSQGLSGLACLIYMHKKFPIIKLTRDDLKPRWYYISMLCGNGLPMGLQYSITAIGSVILQTAINGLGSDVVAAVTASNKLAMFIVCPFDALGSTMATYAGQNVGAMKLKRLKEGLKASSTLGLAYSIFALIFLFFFGKYLLLLFLNSGEVEIIKIATSYLLIQAVFFFPLSLVNIVRFEIQGMGYSGFAVIAGVCEMIARAVVAFTLVPMFGYIGAAYASPLAWIMADAFLIPAFFYTYKRLNRKFKAAE